MIRLEKLMTWTCCVSYDQGHVVNQYLLQMEFSSGTDDEQQQTTAYQRIKWWIHDVMQNSLLLNQTDELLPVYANTRQRVLAMPADPVDDVVALMLFYKLNSIVEQRLVIDRIKLSSDQGDNVWYVHDNDEPPVEIEPNSWWLDSGPTWIDKDCMKFSTEHKVVELERRSSWEDLGLGWEPQSDQPQGNVIFTEFGRR